MSRRETVQPTVTPSRVPGPDREVDETHPAFGVAILARSSGSDRSLFQSDLVHQHTVTLRIARATRTRSLNHDWVHPGKELVEVEMSEAQWGALVSSMGLGSGVPVTIRSTEADHLVPDLPHQPRMAASINEVNEAVGKMLERARETAERLESAIESKAGVKATREALRDHLRALEQAEANSAFAVKSLADATEQVVNQAKADIEIQVLQAGRLVGTDQSIEAPVLPAAIEGRIND